VCGINEKKNLLANENQLDEHRLYQWRDLQLDLVYDPVKFQIPEVARTGASMS
jgi:hypothetical protein